MSENLHLVFSIPPEAISDEEFNAWYHGHGGEIPVTPRWDAARRYALTCPPFLVAANPKEPQSPTYFSYLAAYEVSSDPEVETSALPKEGAASRSRARFAPPHWVSKVRVASWTCTSLEDRGNLHLPEHIFFVFSAPPAGMSFGEYSTWYHEHMEENLHGPGFLRAWRFRLEPTIGDEAASVSSTHLAAYEVDGEVRGALAELREVRSSLGFSYPDWFDKVPFAGVDANAITDRVES